MRHRCLVLLGLMLPVLLVPLTAQAIAILQVTDHAASGQQYSGPSVWTDRLEIEAWLRDGELEVHWTQVFRSSRPWIMEATYMFELPEGAVVSQFATWDGRNRYPGVILEKRKAERLYEELTARYVDPGLLAPTAGRAFQCRISPVPAYGTKLVEMTYHQPVPEYAGQQTAVLPIGGDHAGKFGHARVVVHVESKRAIREVTSGVTGVKATREGTGWVVTWEQEGRAPDWDFSVRTQYEGQRDAITAWSWFPSDSARGYLWGTLAPVAPDDEARPPQKLLVLWDRSYSVGDRDKAIQLKALRAALEKLETTDEVGLWAFNHLVDKLVPIGSATLDRRERIIRICDSLPCLGGTDLGLLLGQAAKELPAGANHNLLLLSDGQATWPPVLIRGIDSVAGALPTVFALGAAENANWRLLQHLALHSDGSFATVRTEEDPDEPIALWASRVLAPRWLQPDLTLSGGGIADLLPDPLPIIPLGHVGHFAARYTSPGPISAAFKATLGGKTIPAEATLDLVPKGEGASWVARLWARLKVDQLLDMINRLGEKAAWKQEIIALSKAYSFVTPYTAFLAAPRAFLRPRVIRPGDPLISVEAPADARRVVVLFPFGQTVPCRWNPATSLWEGRYLIPADVKDGEYEATILVTLADGETVTRTASYRVDATPPQLRVKLVPESPRPGDWLEVRAWADRDACRIVAELPWGERVALAYKASQGCSVARVRVPSWFTTGGKVRVTAEDAAHNSTQAVAAF